MDFSGLPAYRLFVPAQAVGANLVYFDLFNAADSGSLLHVVRVEPVVSGAVAVTGVVAVNLFLTRTSAVGTGGTAATFNGTSLTAATVSALGSGGGQPLPGKVTARLTPTGGATAGAVLAQCSVFTEETNAATYIQTVDLVKAAGLAVDVSVGTGLRVVQGAVASVGNIGFDVLFYLWAKA